MATVTGITLIKKFTYRGDANEEWSNTYHFVSAPPSDDAGWATLVTELAEIEQPVLNAFTTIVRAYGYDSDDDHAASVYTKDWELDGGALTGTYSFSSGTEEMMAGDQAVLVSWRLAVKNTKGKWIYLRKYLHGGFETLGGPDSVSTAYKAALQTYADALDDGSTGLHGGLRARTRTDDVTANQVSPYTTTRTLRRRGKRPLSTP